MVAGLQNHWKTIGTNGFWDQKTLKNHWYQWFLDQKPLKNYWYQWFWRPKTIVKPLISMVVFQPFMVSMKTCKCCNGGNQKANIELKWFPRVTFVTLGQVSVSKVCLFLCFCWTNHVFLRFGLFCEPAFTFPRTIDKPSKSMVSHKPFIQWQWFDCKKPLEKPLIQMVEIWKTIEKTIDTNDSHVKKPLKNHWHQWFTCKKTIENHWHQWFTCKKNH